MCCTWTAWTTLWLNYKRQDPIYIFSVPFAAAFMGRSMGINRPAPWNGVWLKEACLDTRILEQFRLCISKFFINFRLLILLAFIFFSIQSGIQGSDHPNPGREYYAVGFPRVAYIPDNPKGRKVLRLLGEAWHRKLIFTVSNVMFIFFKLHEMIFIIVLLCYEQKVNHFKGNWVWPSTILLTAFQKSGI